jgi:hypothetical protein
MESSEAQLTCWVNILERDGWFLVNVDDKKLAIIISFTETGKEFLRVAGFHLGEITYVGERQNVPSIKVEKVPENLHAEMLPKIHEALLEELRGLPVAFL